VTDWRRRADEAAIAVLLAGLAAALALGGWALRLDRLVYDGGLTLWQRPPPPGIVIVAIDDASVQAIGRWPWRRAVHATLLEQLAKARPRAIALDLLLSEPDPDPEQDRLLALALQHAAPVVLPVTLQSDGAGRQVALPPAPALRAAARLGASASSLESDGVLRDTFLHTRAAGETGPGTPSLALALLEAGGETIHPRTRASLEDEAIDLAGTGAQRTGRLAIRYTGPPGSVEQVSYAEVLAGAVPAERLAGRYLLVGMTAQGLGDTLATPVNSRHLAMPGVEVHAQALYTLRSGDSIRTVQPATVAAVSAALVALLLAAFARFGPRVALPLALAVVPVAVLGSLLALQAGLWFGPAPLALSAALAYPLWSWRRLERTVRSLDGEIARLSNAEAASGAPDAAANPAPRARRTDSDVLDARLHALRRAGAVVRDARRFLADALAALPSAMLVADGQARVLLANPQAAALFEAAAPDELLGLDLARLLGEFTATDGPDWPAALAALQPGAAGLAVAVSLGQGDPAGPGDARPGPGRRDFVVHVAAVNLQDGRRLIVTLADIEPVKQAQREREEVLAFVSHDLRSPASAIVLLADLTLQGRVQTPQTELLQEIRGLAARTLALSDGLVRAAQAQTQVLQRVSVDLAGLLDEVAADLRAQALAADLTLHTRVTPAGARLNADRLLLARALGNLLTNAIKHGPPRSRVELLADVTGGQVRLVVRDQGPGFSPRQRAQLARGGEGAAVGDARGVGLGLLFVQRVAQRHGGSLRAAGAEDGPGTVMTLELPA
jgi:CHASE2 domain-containing sensor protein/signal transduction histidine kinase